MTDQDDGYLFFPMGPGAWKEAPTPLLARLWREHGAEAERKGAEFYNYGWSTSDDGVCSKTSVGYLDSVLRDGQVAHRWIPYDKKKQALDSAAWPLKMIQAMIRMSGKDDFAEMFEQHADELEALAVEKREMAKHLREGTWDEYVASRERGRPRQGANEDHQASTRRGDRRS